MKNTMTRRDFLGGSAALGAVSLMGLGGIQGSNAAESADNVYKTELFSGFIRGELNAGVIEAAAKTGVQGIETTIWNVDMEHAREMAKIATANGIRIHSVMRGWADLNEPDRQEEDMESIRHALRAAAAFGADAILLVPAKVGNPGPAPWDFRVKFDSDCLVSEVVEGDNTPFKEYIDLQNNATIQVRKCLEKLIPVAAYEGITIGVENVWNNLWCTPDFYAAFVSSFDNRWIKSYFDMGNHVKYAPTEEWIRALRGQITKLHIKDFAVDKNAPAGGTFVPIGKGDIKWQQVRDTLEEIGCSSWVTLESDGFTDEEHLQIFKDFFAGKPFSVQ